MKEAALESWFTELVADIKMKMVIPARASYVEAPGNRGLTGSVNIETSHAALHCWDESSPAFIQLDVYSCSCFDVQTVLSKLDEYTLTKYEYIVIDRGDGFRIVDKGKATL
jgi:S-adenosylmethionine/arginine decarboxylase-like enzyme